MFCGSVQRFRYAVRTKHSTFRSAMAVSQYFCFWTASCHGIKDTLAKFENAVLVVVHHCRCVYRYFSRLKNEAFLRSTASLCSSKFLSFSHDLTLPIVRSSFQLTGRQDLIGSARSVEIFAASPSCSTSGSKAYFLFKLHDPTAGESGRQQQLTIRLSSCILDMCEIARKYEKNKVILIILRLKFLKSRAPCAIWRSLPWITFFFLKRIFVIK